MREVKGTGYVFQMEIIVRAQALGFTVGEVRKHKHKHKAQSTTQQASDELMAGSSTLAHCACSLVSVSPLHFVRCDVM